MGSPISPIVANLYMGAFGAQVLNTAPPSSLWRRFVDDTSVVIQAAHKDVFIELVNSIDDRIQFTMKESRSDGSMPFLDTLVIPKLDGSFCMTVYRKPTHTDLYLQWDSHHTIAAKYSVVKTLHHRAKAVCSNSQLLKKEGDHLQRVLLENKYPMWDLNRVKMKINVSTQDQKKRGTNISTNAIAGNQRPYMVVPYVKGQRKHKKCIQKTWGTGALQGRLYHQKPPDDS